MLRRLRVRGKILAALAVPVLVLFIAATFISAQAITEARAASQTSALVDAFAAQDTAGKALAQERADAIRAEYGAEGAAQSMAEARVATDAALDELTTTYKGLSLSALSPRVQRAVNDTLAARADLDALRSDIDGGASGGEIELTRQYSALIDTALDVPRTLSDTTSDRELAQYIDAYVVTDELMAQVTLERPIAGHMLQSAFANAQDQAAPAPAADDKLRVAALVQEGTTLADEARGAVSGLPGITAQLASPDGTYDELRTLLAGSSPESVTAADVGQWDELSQGDLAQIAPARDEVRTTTAKLASDRAGDATTEAIVTIAVTILAAVASVLVAGLIARGIVRPLRRLTVAADEVRSQLPVLVEQVVVPGQDPKVAFTPITVESQDEVGQLAAAFNDVNATTLTVAREQAALRGSITEMFVNVARRDQILLNRQLAFLDDLERTEEDPNALSNLFRLDHLATRMRRNAESLLVLAGIDSGRRVRQPMPASDVIRTASSEIELYDRVRLNLAVDPQILGHNALTAAHLLAELLENATMFSEPHTPVEVTTGYDGQNVQFRVRDHGLGMSPDELAEVNRRVGAHAASEVVGAQRLGLYVVGRLANRLDAKVTFALGPNGTGTDVTVNLPIGLFAPESAGPLQRMTDAMDTTGSRPAPQFVPEPAPSEALPPTTVPVFGGTAVQAEAPPALPVDIEALTDGITTSGMPRRRPRGVEAGAAAPSASLIQGPQTGAIVLPPLATPSLLPLDIPTSDESWTPPDDVTVPGGALPSRQRAGGTPPSAAETPEETPILDVGARTALFSSFRSMGELDTSGASPVELDPAPEVTATDISVGFDSGPATEAWTPQFAMDDGAGPDLLASLQGETSASSIARSAPSMPFAGSESAVREPVGYEPTAYVPGTYEPSAHEPSAYEPSAYEPAARASERESSGVAQWDEAQWTDEDRSRSDAAETQTIETVAASDNWVSALTDETVVRAPARPQDEDVSFDPRPSFERPPLDPSPSADFGAFGELVGQVDLPRADFHAEVPGAFAAAKSFDELLAPDVAAFDRSALVDEATAPPGSAPPTAYDVDRAAPAESYAAGSYPGGSPAADAWSPASPVGGVGPTVEVPAGEYAAPSEASFAPGAQEEIPEELTFDALPRFEELMADLPSRRSMRETTPHKRGLFGRRTRPDVGGQAPGRPGSGSATGGPDAFRAPSAPAFTVPGYKAPGLPAADPVSPAAGHTGDASQADVDQFAPPGYGTEPGYDAAVDAEYQDPYGTVYHGSEDAAGAIGAPAPADGYATGSVDAAPAYVPPIVPEPASSGGQAAGARGSGYDQSFGQYPDDTTGYGPPSPLIRRRTNESFESLDSEYTTDSVEARSDWMASAVLYEEMSSLLRSNDFGDRPLDETPGAYQPVRLETGTPGLTRRARGEDRDGYVDRFTARIERDPEQLRARLAAFQSATARGRAEAEEDIESAWSGGSTEYVSDSAPQAR